MRCVRMFYTPLGVHFLWAVGNWVYIIINFQHKNRLIAQVAQLFFKKKPSR